MSAHPRTPPKSHQMLSRWADGYARRIGEDVARVRRWVAYMALGEVELAVQDIDEAVARARALVSLEAGRAAA